MTTIEFITIVLSTISLIVTIVGWTITAKLQKELLERQISAEHHKTILGFSIPRQLKMIDDVRDWKLEGDRIGINIELNKLNKEEKEDIFQKLLSWREKFYFYGINEKVLLLDQLTEEHFYLLIDNYLNISLKILQHENSEQTFNKLNSELANLDGDITEQLGYLEMKLLQKE